MRQPMLRGRAEKYAEWQKIVDLWWSHESSIELAYKAYGDSIPFGTFASRLKTAKASGIQPTVEFGSAIRPAYLTPGPQQAPKPRISVTAAMQAPAIHLPPDYERSPDYERVMDTRANQRIAWWSDLHAPYHHPDALAFMAAIIRKYEPDRHLHAGDELDLHGLSYHEKDPDLDSAGRELQRGSEVLREFERMVPKLDLCDSNHGSLLYRRGKTHGIPRHMLLDYRDVIFGDRVGDKIVRPPGRGDGWKWHKSITFTLPNGRPCLAVHGMSISTMRNVQQSGMCFLQGHHHGTFEVVYNGTPDALNWGMTAGCLIDDHALAFAYNKNTLKRPVIGCGIILDGQPKLLPMILAKGGRWNGFVP